MLPWLRRHRIVTGGLAGLAVAAAAACGVGAWVLLGGFDTAATAPHLRLVGWAAHIAMENSVRVRARRVQAPARFTAAQVEAGARLYGRDCAGCHGGPGLARAPAARGMIPTPPYLVDAARRWSTAELYEIIGGGVKMTGMPAWRETRSQSQLWSLVAFTQAIPTLTSRQFRKMIESASGEGTAGGPPRRDPG